MIDAKIVKTVLRLTLLIIFIVLTGRLFELQVIKGKYYQGLADGNRVRSVVLKAPRGEVYARGGEHLIKNDIIDSAIYYDSSRGYFVSSDPSETGKKIVDVTAWRRDCPLRDSASHITGYVGAVNTDESGKVASDCIDKGERTPSDFVGRTGLEEYYDCRLRGTDGENLIEVLADGTYVRLLGEKSPIKGGDIKTTISYALQEYVSTLLNGVRGSIIVGDANGEILALYSSPSFDPNVFSEGSDAVGKIFSDKNLPLFNRSISGKYSPGSVYKPIVATAALESGAITENYHFQDTGSIKFTTPYGNYSYSNWYFTQYGGVEGNIEVTKALARSTDTFFYKVGELTGIDKIVEWSRAFGLSGKTGIDLPGEAEGLVPDPAWKAEVKGERWFLGNTYHLSIGQGDLTVTPLEIHSAIEVIANGGKICKQHIIQSQTNNEFPDCRSLGISAANINLVKSGMTKACSTGGTGYTFFDFEDKTGIDVACKTGTAQIGSEEKTNAWFTAYAPVDKPEIVVTVLVEEGGEGSKVAGPIARQIFDFWFKK